MIFMRFFFAVQLAILSSMVFGDVGEVSGYNPTDKIKEIEINIKKYDLIGKPISDVRKIMVEKFNAIALDEKINDAENQLIFIINDKPSPSGVYSSLVCDFRFDKTNNVISMSNSYVNSGP